MEVTVWSRSSQYLGGDPEYSVDVRAYDPYRGGGFFHGRLCPIADEICRAEKFSFLDLDPSRFSQCDIANSHLFCAPLGLESPCRRARYPAYRRFRV